MSKNTPRLPSDTELSIPSDTAELGFDPTKKDDRELTTGDAIQAPGAVSNVPLPVMTRFETSYQVSATLAKVDSTQDDVAFDARVFEREPVSMRSASCAAFSTTLDDATIRYILRSTPTFRKVSSSPKGNVWMYSCSGERSPVPTSEIYNDVRRASTSQGLPDPSVMFMHYGKQQDTSSVLDIFEREASSGFRLLTESSIFVGDEAFRAAVEHPRVKVYVHADIAAQPRGWFGKRFYAMNLRPAINSIRAGGAEKQYGRTGEEKQIRAWVDSTLCSGRYSSMTIHGDPMMGKTRMAAEIVRYVQQNYPDTTLVFAPAMDTHKSDPFHYTKEFSKRLVDGFSKQPDIAKTLVYQQLFDFVYGRKEDMSPNALSALLVSFFQLLPSSSAKLLLIPDDMQWIDTESNAFLKKIFSQHVTFGNVAVLNLTRTGDEVVDQALLSAMQSRDSDSIDLKPLAFLDKNGEPTKMLSAFVADLLRVPEFDVPAGKEYLRRLAKIAQGNPGVLTEVVSSMQQEGIIAAKGGDRLIIDHNRFMAWTETGEADNVVVTKVDRLLRNEQYREILVYLVAFRESGGCDADLFLKFLANVLKKPELANAYTNLVTQQTIGIQQIDGHDEATLSFSQDLVGTRLKKVFTEKESPYASVYTEAHRVIGRFMLDIRLRAGRGGNPQMTSVLDRCNPRAIVTHAYASGVLSKLAEGYAIPAIMSAYEVGDHAAVLEIYKSVVQSNPDLLAEIAKDEKLQLSILHSMTVLRAEWGEMAIALGDSLKKKYLELLNASEQYDEALISRIDHLYELMCNFYFMRGTAHKLREESVLKLAEWASGYGKGLSRNASQDVKVRQGMFFHIKESFYLMQAEYMLERYAQACELYAHQFEMRCYGFSKEFPEAESDSRLQNLKLEATRLSANSWLMGFNRAVLPGQEGVGRPYVDEESCIVSSRDPQSSMHGHLTHAEQLFRTYLAQVADAPDQVMDRTQVYRAKQAFARTLGMLGKYYESFEQFLDARSDAHRYGDPERFADIADGATSMLSNMAKHFLADPHNREFQEMIMSIASLIRRSDQGEAPGDQDVFSSLQYILKKAHQYSEQAVRITADISHSSNFDTAMVNILDILETMMNSHAVFNRPLDPSVLLLLKDALKRVLSPTHLLPDGETPAPTFYERMTVLDKNGSANEYWTLYIAPCLSRLAVGSTRFDSAQVRNVFDPLLARLGMNVYGNASLLDSLHALVDERHTPTKARSFAYDQAINAKVAFVQKAMSILEQQDLVKYYFDVTAK